MKTTVEIADSILDEARQAASARSITLRQVIEEALRKLFAEQRLEPFRLRDGSFGGGGMVGKMNWDQIRDQIYEGRGA